MSFQFLLLALLVSLCGLSRGGTVATSDTAKDDWAFLDNGEVRIGVKKNFGAGIGWFSEHGSQRNLINTWDTGRLVQQSYYGAKDGSVWEKKPWRWNPVQGGDFRGQGAKVLEFSAGTNALYAKTLPRNWAGCTDVTNVIFEEWISLTGRMAHVRFKMTYAGTNSHPMQNQEIPALFAAPDLATLLVYDGDKPWTDAPASRSRPGWPNEPRKMTEHWAAYVDKNDYGIGALVPAANRLTCYRFGDGNPQHGACSYFAPITDFAITPGKVFEYDLYLTLGSAQEIRNAFKAIMQLNEGLRSAAPTR